MKEYKDVKFIDKNNTYIDDSVKIEKGTVIEPFVILKGNTVIGKNCIIGAFTEITDTFIGDNVNIKHSVIIKSTIKNNTNIGPFAYLRPDCNIGNNVKIGDFVEIKNSNIDDNTKVAHLTYVGDSDVGKNINFGCGTVTVNYDGTNKHRTTIKDGAFIGCNTNLIAPVTIEENVYTAAGSTITDNVPKNSLAIARARQINKNNWNKKK